LKQQINRKALSFKTEEVSPPNTPMRALLQYRNIPKIYFRIVKINYEITDEEQLYGENFLKKFSAESPVISWEVELPRDSDKNGHAVEVKIPELPLGRYAIMVSDNSAFSIIKKAVAYSLIDISNFSVIR